MTTLITGGTGFVGIALTEHLLSRGENVVSLDIAAPPAEALASFRRGPGQFDFVEASVCNGDALAEAMKKHAPRRLVTLAAITADANRESTAPNTIFDVNVGGTVAAIAAAAKHGVERVVHVSSGSVYGASGKTAKLLVEGETPQKPEGLYGISKQAAEAAALRLADLYGLDLVAARLGTCYGPWERDTGARDTLSALLQILRLAQRGERVVLPRTSTRDWLYVRDGAAGIGALLEHRHLPHRIYNAAAGFEFSTDQWCERIAQCYPNFSWKNATGDEKANVNLYNDYDRASMDIRRLRAETDFVPRFDLDSAFADFRAWLTQRPADVGS